MKNPLSLLLLLSVFLVVSCNLFGHSGDEHAREIGEVFGLCDENGKSRGYAQSKELIKDLGECISKFIDQDSNLVTKNINNQIARSLIKYTIKQRDFSAYKPKLHEISQRLYMILKRFKQSPSIKINTATREELERIISDMEYLPGYQIDSENLIFLLNRAGSLADIKLKLSELYSKIEQDQGIHRQDVVTKINSLAKDERLFRLVHGGHRVLFHWGFNNSPRTYPHLIDCVDLSVSEIKKLFPFITSEDYFYIQNMIYDVISDEWNKRKNIAMKKFENLFYNYNKVYPENADQIRSLLSIAYNVHILGDYSDIEIDPLVSVEDISESLREGFMFFDSDDRNETRKICDAVTQACRSSYQKRKAAAAVLSVLKKNLPNYLEHCPRMRSLLRGQ